MMPGRRLPWPVMLLIAVVVSLALWAAILALGAVLVGL